MVELRSSRSGRLTAVVGGTAIHSLYDPAREARRFIEAGTTEPPGTIVILGEGVGHLSRAAREAHPAARVLAVHFATELWVADPGAAHAAWHPGAAAGLERFLREQLSELDVEGLRVLEWPPSSAAFPASSRRALEQVAQVVRELNGTVSTSARFGRLWLRNAARNFLLGPDPLSALPLEVDLPVLVAASGPSLADAAPLLRELRGRLNVWALPSAVDHLLSAGVIPDLVVLTDPSYYSAWHAHAARGLEVCIALPLSAAAGLWRVSSRVVYLRQPTFYEEPLVSAFGDASPAVPPHGTVAGSALELALSRSPRAPVILAGLDFCYRDILSHARPNAFEHFLLPGSGRLSPLHHRIASAAIDAAPTVDPSRLSRTSLPLQTYAGWFATAPAAWAGRVRRLLPSPVSLPAVSAISADELRAACPEAPRAGRRPDAERRRLPRDQRREILLGLIRTWRGWTRDGTTWADPADARALGMARQLALRELMEAKRAARREGPERGRELWEAALEGIDRYLGALEHDAAGTTGD
jgi:hypothetical protein